MKYEPYSIRANFILFKSNLEECVKLLESMSSIEDVITLQKNFMFLSKMCCNQSLYIIEKTNANIALSACANSLMNVKSEYLEDANSDIMNTELVNISRSLKGLIESVDIKCANSIAEMSDDANIEKTVEKLEDYRASAELIQEYKETVKATASKSEDGKLYEKLNKRAVKEIALVRKTLDAGLTFVRGSVTVNSYIRPYDLKDLDYSVLKIPGISYNHARKETITPIYVFHNQKLAIINVKKRKLSIRGTRYRDADEVFIEKLEAIENSTNLVNQTKKFQTPYLMSPEFKNIRFLWFSENLEAFKNTKDGTVRLLW